jgi:predicted phosphate transport protein (TIGR00153 family)
LGRYSGFQQFTPGATLQDALHFTIHQTGKKMPVFQFTFQIISGEYLFNLPGKGETVMVRLPFIPKEHKFFELFEESAENILKAAEALNEMVDTWEFLDSRVAEITELEHHGDTITHQIISLLHRTFVTPFDREDIALLAHTMDDVIDFIHSAADAMFIYKVDKPTERAKELADIIVRGAAEIQKVVPGLRRRSTIKKIMEGCVEINRLENMADRVYRAAIAELFDNTSDVTQIIKWREIYEHMESATDRCEDVANVLEGVALKHA